MSRKPGRPPSETGKGRVRFIFEPDRTSPNGVTYSWLIHKTYNGKEKAATAVRAFWLPFAYQEAGESTEAELKAVHVANGNPDSATAGKLWVEYDLYSCNGNTPCCSHSRIDSSSCANHIQS